MVALDIAERAGLVVPQRRLVSVGNQQVLLVRRFDRRDDGSRVGYISARTLLGKRELGAHGDYQVRGIGPRLRQHSPDAKRDMDLLWRQAVLNLLVNNTDNHLRNHGFLREGNGWALSPVFDLDPNPDTGTMFATRYDGAVQRMTGLRNVLHIAKALGIAEAAAKLGLEEMVEGLDGWDALADGYGATDSEIALFGDVFTGLIEPVRVLIGS